MQLMKNHKKPLWDKWFELGKSGIQISMSSLFVALFPKNLKKGNFYI